MASRSAAMLPTHFRNIRLDEFQAQAIWHLQRGSSTLVSAPTGTGKTVIADYLVDSCLKEGKRVIYTAPIKALVNQKYRNYARLWGKNQIGILTGDVSENPQAPVLVMTTEVFRNMLLSGDSGRQNITWAVFDEIHYLDHAQRGTVWEEALLFMPGDMRLLGLSATVPNIDEIASWIESLHGHRVAVITRNERAVPLEHLYYNSACGAVPPEKLKVRHAEVVLADRGFDSKGGALDDEDIGALPRVLDYRDASTHIDLVQYVASHGLFPCLFFVMSRKGCEEKASELSCRADYLDARAKEAVRVTVKQELAQMRLASDAIPRFTQLNDMWRRGIAYHHAGMLPAAKRIVESLLERRLLRVLYATETFAVGVNMPVRTVCFDSLKKYDGLEMRYLTHGEYFQMAGRAGRRGFDRQGTVIAMVDFGTLHRDTPPEWKESLLEPITSRMHLTYNFVANLVARSTDAQVRIILGQSLAGYQGADQPVADRLFSEYLQKKEALKRLEYLDAGGGLLPRGETCRRLYVQEVLLTELIHSGFLASLDTESLSCLSAALVYEPRPGETPFAFNPPRWLTAIDLAAARLNQKLGDLPSIGARVYPAITPLIAGWIRKRSLAQILRDYPIPPGDFVAACRRAIDLLRQIADAARHDSGLVAQAQAAISVVDRDAVSVKL